jgi:hypothetical protein
MDSIPGRISLRRSPLRPALMKFGLVLITVKAAMVNRTAQAENLS